MDHQIIGISRRPLRGLCRWSILLFLFALAPLFARAEDTVTFSLNLPDGLTYTETSHSTNSMQVAAGEKSMKETTEQTLKSKTEIHKTKAGYAITETVISVDQTKDGEAVDADSFLLASVGIPITYNVNKDGKLLSVDGIDKVAASCKKHMSAEDQRTSGYLITEKGILDANKVSWYEDTQSLIGRTAKVGVPWKISVTYPMPNGKQEPVTETISMIGSEQNNGHDGVRLHYTKLHDLKALAEARAYFFKEMMADGDSDSSAAPHVTIKQATEEGDNVLDVHTLQPLSSSTNSTIVSELKGPHDETMEITESTDEETSVDYNPGAFTLVPQFTRQRM